MMYWAYQCGIVLVIMLLMKLVTGPLVIFQFWTTVSAYSSSTISNGALGWSRAAAVLSRAKNSYCNIHSTIYSQCKYLITSECCTIFLLSLGSHVLDSR